MNRANIDIHYVCNMLDYDNQALMVEYRPTEHEPSQSTELGHFTVIYVAYSPYQLKLLLGMLTGNPNVSEN